MSVGYTGRSDQNVAHRGQDLFLKGIRIPPNDSLSAPETIIDGAGVTLTNGEIRGRTNGSIDYWNGTAWVGVGSESYTNYSDVPTTGKNATIFFTNDDSPNGDGAEGVAFRVNNTLLTPILIKA